MNFFLKATFLLALIWCSFNASAQFEGKINMSISVKAEDPDMAGMEAFMPTSMTYYVKQSKARVETSTIMGNMIMLMDTVKREMITCMDMMGKKIAMVMSLDEMQNSEDAKKAKESMKIDYTKDTKVVAGYTCKKAKVSMDVEGSKIETDIWYTEEIQNFNTEYQEIKGFPLEFSMTAQGFTMSYSTTAISKELVADNLFEVPEGYELTTQEELQKKMGGQ
ncbi:MAG: hypothetical protein RL220_2069 [Bacteroidota bacterium]